MKRRAPFRFFKSNPRGQATTELAVAGAIVIIALSYIIQYGYIYNSRQALEMYTFRKALQLSQDNERGITLTVVRDVILPSFFTGISRQRLMATAAVEYNPYYQYIPYAEDPEDVGTLTLLQINDGMIRNNQFVQVPPTMINAKNATGGYEKMWWPSALGEVDSQARTADKISAYNYSTRVSQNKYNITVVKNLVSRDTIPMNLIFDNDALVKHNLEADDWESKIGPVTVYGNTIPKNITVILEEEVRKGKDVYTPK